MYFFVIKNMEGLRNALPDGEQLKHSVQQAATKVRETGSALGDQVQASANKLGQRTQETVSAATSLGANLQAKSSDWANGLRDRE